MFGNKIKLVAAGLLVVVLMFAGAAGSVVLAQGPTPTVPPTGTSPTPPPTTGPKAGTTNTRVTLVDLFWQSLAKRLGITVATLQQAIRDAGKDALAEAVKQGLLTQKQADNLGSRLQNLNLGKNWIFPGLGGKGSGTPFTGRQGFMNGFMNGRRFGTQRGFAFGETRGFIGPDWVEAAAKALNMTPADVTKALQSGKTLADLAKSQNVDAAKVQSALADALKASLARAVTDGLMTADRANALKAQIDPSKINLSQPFLGMGFGMMQGLPGSVPGNQWRMPGGRGMMPFWR